MSSVKFSTLVSIICLLCMKGTLGRDDYYMDKFSDCGKTLNVDDDGVKIHGRSLVAPSNPPLRCVIYLRSSYTRNDGSNKLQIEVNYLDIRDCNIKLDLFNGRKSVGDYLKALSCQIKPTGVIYSNSNEVTVKLSRYKDLTYSEYGFTLIIKPWKDGSVIGSKEGNDKISVGAIIGIVIGGLVIVVVLILLCWCCCTGRISGFGGKFAHSQKSAPGHVNNAMMEEKYRPPAVVLNEPAVWSTKAGGDDDRFQPRYFQRGIPRNDMRPGGGQANHEMRQWEGGRGRYGNAPNDRPPYRGPPRPAFHDAPYETDRVIRKPSPQQPRKETMIDDVFDSDSNSNNTQTSDVDDATLQKRPIGEPANISPRSKRKSQPIPEEDEPPQLQRYKSMDLQSQPDTDTITSPVHVNAGVRASVEDDVGGSPMGSLRKNKKGSRSPKMKHKDGKQPDYMAMPPEAFEPIFTEPISGINYPTNQYQPGYGQMAPQIPGGFMPYGLIPSGAFAPGVPGSQTYAYAYQTVPPGGGVGQPASQGAWVVQNTPTSDGNRRTAYAVEETMSPDRSSPHGKRKKNSDPFGRSPYRDSGNSSKKGRGQGKGYTPDLSVVTRGAAPPEPGQGHRSVALKSGTDPDTGIHTVQGVWTDTVPDPTDPDPGVDNPQITRKTITRVTTKSGYRELPPENDPLIALEAEPAFLSPSSRPTQAYTPAIMPPNRNIDFYTGAGSMVPPPERSSTPTSTRPLPKYNGAIRDRIPLDDSTV